MSAVCYFSALLCYIKSTSLDSKLIIRIRILFWCTSQHACSTIKFSSTVVGIGLIKRIFSLFSSNSILVETWHSCNELHLSVFDELTITRRLPVVPGWYTNHSHPGSICNAVQRAGSDCSGKLYVLCWFFTKIACYNFVQGLCVVYDVLFNLKPGIRVFCA